MSKKFKTWVAMILCAKLLAGCVTPEYCDVGKPIFFKGPETIQYLSENDVGLLSSVVSNNKKYEQFCM